MILESLEAINDPFLAKRDEAADLYDHRFKEAELTCKHCEGVGWRLEDAMEVYKCGKCQGGSIYTLLCSRCGRDENGCDCAVHDFM